MDNSKLLVRMTTEDRQAINRMIQHKRKEFESVIEKGVVAMLNAQEEHEKLAERRAEYLGFLSQRNRQKKEQLQQLTQTAKESISQAPMGIGAAGQIALTAAATAGDALYENAEQTRQQTEAEQRLFAAQMLYYIPAQDYDRIAKKIANILSYRYQFLIFRLAAGEEGYIKLANFFVHSMKGYAISRLREHKNDVIRALINAAIPPSTDTLNYRDWPSIDFANFRTHFTRLGTHKILALDSMANQIIKRCGPAVRALLGGYDIYVTPDKAHLKNYHSYTLIGALNHTLILNVDGRIHAGILPDHRPCISLDGNVKYPMILLGKGESTADLGVNFATQTTDIILEPIHLEALKRLVPDFFEHEVKYQIESTLAPKITAADIRYSEEKYECPWNPKREHQWQEKLQMIMSSKKSITTNDDIESFNQSSEQRLMNQAANQYYLKTLMLDAQDIYQETYTAIASVFHPNANIDFEKQKVAQKAIYSLYIAQEIIYAMHLTQMDKEQYLSCIRNLINMAHLGIYASREWAFHETFKYHMTRVNLLKIQQQLDNIQHAHQLFSKAYFVLVESIEELPYFKSSKKFLTRETQNHYRKIRHYKNQIHEQLLALEKMMNIRQSILQFELQTVPPMQSVQEAFEDVIEEIKKCQNNLFPDSNDYHEVLHQISMVQLDMHLSLLLIEEIHQKDPRNPVVFKVPLPKNIQELRHEHTQNQIIFEQLKNKSSPFWIQARMYHRRLQELKQFLTPLIEKRDALHQTLSSMTYEFHIENVELNHSIQSYFQRAYIAMQIYFLSYFNNNSYHQQDHSNLYQKTKNFYLSFKIESGQEIDMQYHQILTLAQTTNDMEIYEVQKILQQVKKEKDALELQIRDDIEMTSIGLNQAQLYSRDAELYLVEIQEFQQKIDFIRENTDKSEDFIEISHEKTPENEEVIHFFQDKIQFILKQISQSNLLIEQEQEALESHFKSCLEKFETLMHETKPSQENWMKGIHFLSKTIKGMFQIEFKKWKDSLTLEPLKKHLYQIQTHQSSDVFERSMTQKKAMQFLIQTYQNVLELENQRKKFNPEKYDFEIKAWHYMRNALIWSSRLNLSERKWIDKKLASQSKKAMENTQDIKSASRMAYSFILNLVNEYLVNKKRDLIRLRKLEHGMGQIRLLPIDLESTPHDDEIHHESFLQKKEKFYQILTAKISAFEKELDELICSRKILLSQILRISFNEWHKKTFENSPYHQRSLFSQDQKKNNIKSPDPENVSDKPDSHYSIETLETWFESFKQKTNTNLTKSESDSGEDSSPTIESLSMITPQLTTLGLNYSAFGKA